MNCHRKTLRALNRPWAGGGPDGGRGHRADGVLGGVHQRLAVREGVLEGGAWPWTVASHRQNVTHTDAAQYISYGTSRLKA